MAFGKLTKDGEEEKVMNFDLLFYILISIYVTGFFCTGITFQRFMPKIMAPMKVNFFYILGAYFLWFIVIFAILIPILEGDDNRYAK
jgi:hypothetical protein